MGFCRRCGDIVVGPRCKCGGTAVAPAVKWPDTSNEPIQDKWSKTYVTRPDNTPTRSTDAISSAPSTSGPSVNKRFPRPAVNTSIGTRVSAHIASATASRPPSPLKQSSTFSQPDDAKPEEGILPSPHGSELAKVYGSVLQPKETLASFACASCLTPFPPDATIYPDPSAAPSSSDNGTRFLCRSCFISNGGSRGDCPTCSRPVLVLKSEGGFVESAGRVWHKKCFICDGCGRNIGDNPMVDLLSRPCCPDCFDSCLKRPLTDSPGDSNHRDNKNDYLGGPRRDSSTRESSPAIDELEKRLGISKTPKNAAATVSSSPYDARPKALPGLSTPERAKSFSPSVTSSSPSTGRYKSPEPESCTERGSPISVRYTQTRLKSPELEEESLTTRRRYRYRSPARDSPTGSPVGKAKAGPRSSTSQPTEEAIEEMKRRFLTGSPASTPTKPTVSSNSSTPRRRSRSRSRARPRASDTSVTSSSSLLDDAAKRNRTLRSSASTSSLRSTLRSQRTGDADSGSDMIYPDLTGESTRPLNIVRGDRTGESQATLQEDITGGMSNLSGAPGLVRPQRTGEVVYGIESQGTGLTVQPQRTGGTEYTILASQATGGTTYTELESVANQRTGDGIGSQHTGYGMFLPLRPQKSGDRGKSKSSRRESNEGAVDTLRVKGNRTGDAEVASLLGSSTADDLIDFSGRSSLPNSRQTVSMSKIPLRVGARGSPARESISSASTPNLSEGYESSVSSTPDLASDFSDNTSGLSSGPSTPPSLSPPLRSGKGSLWNSSNMAVHNHTTPTKSRTLPASITIPDHVPHDARCEKCKELLFSIKHGGKFVTVPEEPTSTGSPPKRYHTACFRCKICGDVFEEREGGHAVFVRVEEGACHVRCAPPEKITLRKAPSTPMPKLASASSHSTSSSASKTSTAYYSSSSRYEGPLPTAPPQSNTFTGQQPRFGGSASCPGCHKAVSPMERGVVPGPQGTRWHASCLICGGDGAKGRRKEEGKPGCGKKLDSAAKSDPQGGVWCRECLLLLPAELRQPPLIRSPIVPNTTGNRPMSFVAPQYTGTTTLARQFTGLGVGDAAVPRHATGGSYSPAKVSTKMYDGPRPGHVYPRPKSVTGTRSGGGEGRGMFLVRQLTGGSSSFKSNDYGL